MKIVVTGATGMIGAELVRIAAEDTQVDTIYAVVRPGSARMDRLPDSRKIKPVVCDSHQYEDLPRQIPEGCDVLYHFAWLSTGGQRNVRLEDQAENITITLRAVKAAATLGCRLFVGAGSQAEYGYPEKLPMGPRDRTDPVQAYGIAKLAAGKLSRQLAHQLGIRCAWVRIFSIYGPEDKPGTMIMSTFRKITQKLPAEFTSGENHWDYLYSADAGKAFLALAKADLTEEVYCLGSGEDRTLREYIGILEDVLQPEEPFRIGALDSQRPLSIRADISALVRDTHWRPETDFADGVRQIKQKMEVLRSEENIGSHSML